MNTEQRVSLVTGAGSGIGKASAERLGRDGTRVVAVDVRGEAAEQTAAGICALGGWASAAQVDIGARTEVDGVVATTIDQHGRIDCLVHCAAIAIHGQVLDLTDEDWQAVLRVNLDGSFWLGRSVGRAMAEAGRGAMVFLTSDRGILGAPDSAPYAASKGGLIALVKSLALALGSHGVTVNAINPGTTDTPMARAGLSGEQWNDRVQKDPLGRLSRPEEIAEIVAFLCGPAASFMTGQVVTTRMR